MTVKRKIAVCILTVLLLCNLVFIWGNSLANQSESHNLSVGVLTFLPRFIRGLFPNQEQLVHFVRKMATLPNLPAWEGCPVGCWPPWGK